MHYNGTQTKAKLSITFTILDIIRRPVFYLKHGVLETGFCLRLQVRGDRLALSTGPN
jgi:hypothetical protein